LRGKLGYVAPERLERAPAGPRADLFSLGVVLHEMLTGRPLFPGGAYDEALAQVAAPSASNAAAPAALDRVCARALARHPADGYAAGTERAPPLAPIVHELAWGPSRSSHELRALFAIAALSPQLAPPSFSSPPLVSPRRKRRWAGAAAALAVL